jgi:hypothetical protein
VFTFLQVRQFVHHDQSQEAGRCLLEERGDADLSLGLELVALHA